MTENKNDYSFRVDDDGCGVKDKYVSRLFVLFGEDVSGCEKERHGIGLYICKMIVDNHKGKIWYENSPIGGSYFIFNIPKNLKDYIHK